MERVFTPFLMAAAVLGFSVGALAGPVRAEKMPLERLSAYLNQLGEARARFTQANSDGSLSTGVLYIKRPGRARFEYDPPNDALVIAGGSQLAIFDAKSNQPPEQYPLKKTPLHLILKRKVDLGASNMVVGHYQDGPATVVVAQDPENPDRGSIQLFFTDDPIELRKWTLTDEGGTQTTVILDGMDLSGGLGASLFSIPQEIDRRLN